MTTYKEWLHRKVEKALDRYEQQRGFRPKWPPDPPTHSGRKRELPDEWDEPLPFDRRRIIAASLHRAERIFACYSAMLVEPVPEDNRAHFHDWMDLGNDIYDRALRLDAKLNTGRAPVLIRFTPVQRDLFEF